MGDWGKMYEVYGCVMKGMLLNKNVPVFGSPFTHFRIQINVKNDDPRIN